MTSHNNAPSSAYHYYRPLEGHRLAHNPLKAIVAPRPIGWISSKNPTTGTLNLAPFSCFNMVNFSDPPIMAFSAHGSKDTPMNLAQIGQGEKGDIKAHPHRGREGEGEGKTGSATTTGTAATTNIARPNAEFVWNLVTRELGDKMNTTSAMVAPDVDEFALAGVTPAPSTEVSVPRVAESPVSFECKLAQAIPLTSASGTALPVTLFLGEVVGIHIHHSVLRPVGKGANEEGEKKLSKPELLAYDTVAGDPISRGGGTADYFGISKESLFLIERPE